MARKSQLDVAIEAVDVDIDVLEGQLSVLFAAKARLVAQRKAQKQLRQDAYQPAGKP